jgi:glycosyltransferase involved in cell wall biosynthesis
VTGPIAPDRPVRVVQVLPVDGIGGVEAAARSALGHDAGMAFALAPMAGAVTPDLPGTVLTPRFRRPDDPRAIADTLGRVSRFAPDVVVGSLWRSVPVLVALRAAPRRPRLVCFLHVETLQHLPDRLLSAAGIAAADAIWCDSTATQSRRLTAAQRRRSRVISFVTERLPAPPDRPPSPDFVIWARLNRQKGIDRAIALVAALRALGVPAHYRVHGPDGGVEAALIEQARSALPDGAVSFPGPLARHDRAAVAGRATFFLQLSRFEGMAMGVVEAMQLGLVPVVTAVGEIARYVRDGENGLVVDPERLPDAAVRLAGLLADPPRLAAMRAAAIATWSDAPLYRDDVARAARALAGRPD